MVNGRDGIWDGDAGQSQAVPERHDTDRSYRVRDDDAGQMSAVEEGIVTDRSYRVT